MVIRYANMDDAPGMLELDYRFFPEEWHVKPAFTKSVFERNEFSYRIIERNGVVKGYYALYPIKKHIFESLMDGNISEDDIIPHIQPYHGDEELCLYFASINTDIEDSRYISYFHKLGVDFADQLIGLSERNIRIEEIGAIAITDEGKNLCKKLGFYETNRIEDTIIYRIGTDDFLKGKIFKQDRLQSVFT